MIVSTCQDKSSQGSLPWYKEPWAWFVLAPLLVVVPISLFFVSIAFKYSDDVIADENYREGKLIGYDFEAENFATKAGINGELYFDIKTHTIWFTLNNNSDSLNFTEPPHNLILLLSHPVLARNDQEILLQAKSDNKYYGHLGENLTGNWYVQITAYSEPNHNQARNPIWRLRSKINLTNSHNFKI